VVALPELTIQVSPVQKQRHAILYGGSLGVKVSEPVEFDSGRVVWEVEPRIDGAVRQLDASARLFAVSGTGSARPPDRW
jgi:hypothetical protein